MRNILSSVASTIIGGAILAFFFFLVSEKFFPIPDVSGKWKVVSKNRQVSLLEF